MNKKGFSDKELARWVMIGTGLFLAYIVYKALMAEFGLG